MSFVDTIRQYEKIVLNFMKEGQPQNAKHVPYPKSLPGFGPTHDYPFVPLEQALIPIVLYTAMILFGALFMREERQLLNKNLVFILKFFYNFMQVFLCGYMSVEALILKFRHNIPVIPFSHADCTVFSGKNPHVANVLWLFYVSKIFDYADTFFIIVNGKVKQFSFLHIYHHLSVFAINWININVAYDGEIVTIVMLNAAVHTIMYSYYLITMHTDNVWWKKYVTQIQLVQFTILISNGVSVYVIGCSTPPRVLILYVVYVLSLLILFFQFYLASYNARRDEKKKK